MCLLIFKKKNTGLEGDISSSQNTYDSQNKIAGACSFHYPVGKFEETVSKDQRQLFKNSFPTKKQFGKIKTFCSSQCHFNTRSRGQKMWFGR